MSKRSAFYSQGESLVQQDEINTLTEKLAYMKIINMRDTRLSLYIFNLVMERKQMPIVAILCSVILSVFIIGHSYAGTWRDKFDGNELNGWERIVEENLWRARWILRGDHGYLHGSVRKPKQEEVTAADFLHWNAHQFQLNKLTVVGEEIDYLQDDWDISGELGLFLGKRQPVPDFAEGYLYSPEKITKMQFTTNSVYKRGEVKADYSLMFRLTSSSKLKVVFSNGKFRLFTQDLLITEFFDVEIPTIDVVGLMVVFEFPGQWFGGDILTFSVSGQGIPNHNSLDVQLGNTQLATTWGELKRF